MPASISPSLRFLSILPFARSTRRISTSPLLFRRSFLSSSRTTRLVFVREERLERLSGWERSKRWIQRAAWPSPPFSPRHTHRENISLYKFVISPCSSTIVQLRPRMFPWHIAKIRSIIGGVFIFIRFVRLVPYGSLRTIFPVKFHFTKRHASCHKRNNLPTYPFSSVSISCPLSKRIDVALPVSPRIEATLRSHRKQDGRKGNHRRHPRGRKNITLLSSPMRRY